MQREFTENLNKILQCVSETASDVAELNVDLLSRITHSSITPGNLNQIRKPDDWLKVLNTANLELVRYSQDLSEIYIANAQRFGKIMTDMGHISEVEATKAVNKATKFAKKVKRKVTA